MSLSKSDFVRILAAPCVQLEPPAFDMTERESSAIRAVLGVIDRSRAAWLLDEEDGERGSATSSLAEQLDRVSRHAAQLETTYHGAALELQALEQEGLTLSLVPRSGAPGTRAPYLAIKRLGKGRPIWSAGQ